MSTAAGGRHREIASCRFGEPRRDRAGERGWGFGPGGIDVSGSKGRISIRYRDGGTSPFVPFERLQLTNAAGTATIPVPESTEFLEPAVADFAGSLDGADRPAADGAQALHVLEATVAAYASAASGETGPSAGPQRPAFTGGVAVSRPSRRRGSAAAVRRGLVRPGRRGRPLSLDGARAAPASLRPDDVVLALDIGGTKLAAGVVVGDGRILSMRVIESRAEQGPEQMIARHLSLGRAAVADSGVAWERIRGVGVACAGADPFAGVIQSPPNLPGWDNVDLAGAVEGAYGLPVAVDNDATACALASTGTAPGGHAGPGIWSISPSRRVSAEAWFCMDARTAGPWGTRVSSAISSSSMEVGAVAAAGAAVSRPTRRARASPSARARRWPWASIRRSLTSLSTCRRRGQGSG
jgi:hypothetical protein